ncbi:uncharacterized protein LOC133530399 [Cydia pomonella]|uniref:uncharacterized protein LOC133530399 n=1 Tax=Cydia pomonella TaxID=82600 RepID=UPI002ADE7997|nr:uncharacterized protein LOC133530399 [Cydia pomonella]
MDTDSLIRICSTGFKPEAIAEAKRLLYESIGDENAKMISRRKEKEKKDLEDMITLLHNTSAEKIPIFVAKDLHLLPPVNFDHLDATRLLKDLLILQSQVRDIRETFVTKEDLNVLKSEVQNQNKALNSITNSMSSFANVNYKRGAYLFDGSSGPMGMTFNSSAVSVTERDDVDELEQARVPLSTTVRPHISIPPQLPSDSRPRPAQEQQRDKEPVAIVTKELMQNSTLISNSNDLEHRSLIENKPEEKLTYSDVLQKEGEWKYTDEGSEGEWILNEKRKRYRNQFVSSTGKATIARDAKFKPAEIKIPLFISNVHTDVSENDVVNYIYEKTNERVSLSKLSMKRDKGYNSYKAYVDRTKLNIYLDDNMWPAGITFRRFVTIRRTDKAEIRTSEQRACNNNNK